MTRQKRLTEEQMLKYNYNLVPNVSAGTFGYSLSEGILSKYTPVSSLAGHYVVSPQASISPVDQSIPHSASEPEMKRNSVFSRASEKAAKAKKPKEKP